MLLSLLLSRLSPFCFDVALSVAVAVVAVVAVPDMCASSFSGAIVATSTIAGAIAVSVVVVVLFLWSLST